MKIKWHWGSKDGGAESHVYAYGLECKALASVLVLRFEDGSRDAYHSHAFDAVSWVLSGHLLEHVASPETGLHNYPPGVMPVRTLRNTFHRVISCGRTWVLSLRGPWVDTWVEAGPTKDDGRRTYSTLTHGRRVVN
jgi:hypothetical protein